MEEAAAGKIRLQTVESMTDGTIKRLVGGWRLNGRSVDQERRQRVVSGPQVSRCATVNNSVSQHSDLVLYVLRDPQPLKADERISDVVGALRVEDQPCRRIQHQLESTREVVWDSDQHAFAVVQPGVAYRHQGDDQRLERGRWHAPTDLSQRTQSNETARYRSLKMLPHRQVSVDVDAQITNEQRWVIGTPAIGTVEVGS